MSDFQGHFVWYELMTTDTEAAKTFYGTVVGWDMQAAPAPNTAYTLFLAGTTAVAGLMTLPEEARSMGARPGWTGYVAVDDVDATANQAVGLGGRVHVPPTDIPTVGRFAVIADPQGAVLALFKDSMADPCQPPPLATLGHTGWHELMAADWEKALEFYGALFGWTRADAMDMGEMGVYQLFAVGGQTCGGMFNKPPAVPAPHWLYYFNVEDIDTAVARVTTGGGTIVMGPMEVPGGGWIVQGTDPQGVMFALFGKRP